MKEMRRMMAVAAVAALSFVTWAKTPVAPPEIAPKAYNGEAQTADVPVSPYWTVMSNPGGKSAGAYGVFLVLDDPDSYTWLAAAGVEVDGELAVVPFMITKATNIWTTPPAIAGWRWGEPAPAPVAAARFGVPRVLYSGTTVDGRTVNGAASVTAAGSYTASFTVDGTDDYSGLAEDVAFTVLPGVISGGGGSGGGGASLLVAGWEGPYDGKGHSISVSVSGADGEAFDVSYSRDEAGPYSAGNPVFTNAGAHVVWYRVASANYAPFTNSATVAISKAGVASPAIPSKPYTGAKQTADVPASSRYRVVRNEGGTMAGQYAVVLALVDGENYKWTGSGDETLVLPFEITCAENAWTSGPTMPGGIAGFPVATARYGDVEVRYNGTDVDGGNVSNALQITRAGVYAAHFNVRGTSSWTGLSAIVPLTVAADGGITAGEAQLEETAILVNGSLSIPRSWFTRHEGFSEKFGTDFAKAATMETGKVDGDGNAMQVWQDYVAGTDPTDADSKFTVRIEMRDGRPKVTWTPDANAGGARSRKRVYTVWGKRELSDGEWTPDVDETSGEWKFFKVTVGMPR